MNFYRHVRLFVITSETLLEREKLCAFLQTIWNAGNTLSNEQFQLHNQGIVDLHFFTVMGAGERSEL